MAKVTIVFGFVLIAIGVVGYLGTESTTESASAESGAANTGSADTDSNEGAADVASESDPSKRSITALIPAFVGLNLVLFGFLALNDSYRKLAMHIAVVVGFFGTIAGAGRGAMGLGKFFSGDPSLNQRSFLFVWMMAIVCGAYVFLCVQSFRAARKARATEQAI
ncbi:MAG: hypothetical protein AAGG48_27090 [Planctomycetota bacterium]